MRTPHSLDRRSAVLSALLLGLGLPACDSPGKTSPAPASTDKRTGPPDLSGKTDGAPPIAEQGRVSATEQGAELSGRLLEWRFPAYAATRVRVTVTSPDGDVDPYVAIAGPVPNDPDTVVGFNDDAAPGTVDATLELTLPAPGAYRLVVGASGEAPAGGRVTVKYECLSGCDAPELTLAELLAALRADVGEDKLRDVLSQAIPALFPDPDTAAAISAQVDGALSGLAPSVPFPVLPLSAIGSAQALLEGPGEAVPPPAPVTFQLDALLTEACHPERSALKPVSDLLPGLQTGGPPDYTIDDCALQRAQEFANVLNNLALDNGSSVTSGATTYASVEDVFSALIQAGHHVTITNDRFFADFLGLYYKGASVAAPVWIDTGIPLSGGQPGAEPQANDTFVMPAPHSHHTIDVRGPLVNATLMFYMGVSGGVSFRAVSAPRPHWTGGRTLYTYDSAVNPDAVIQLMVTAARLRKQWTAEGQGLKALGYGQIGVCNDSTAVLEASAEQTVTIFPLAHPASDRTDPPKTDIDRLLAGLPSDLAGFDPADAARRIRSTLAFDPPGTLPFAGMADAVGRLPQ